MQLLLGQEGGGSLALGSVLCVFLGQEGGGSLAIAKEGASSVVESSDACGLFFVGETGPLLRIEILWEIGVIVVERHPVAGHSAPSRSQTRGQEVGIHALGNEIFTHFGMIVKGGEVKSVASADAVVGGQHVRRQVEI